MEMERCRGVGGRQVGVDVALNLLGRQEKYSWHGRLGGNNFVSIYIRSIIYYGPPNLDPRNLS